MNQASLSFAVGMLLIGIGLLLFDLHGRVNQNMLFKRLSTAPIKAASGAESVGITRVAVGNLAPSLRRLLALAGSIGQRLAGTAHDRKQLRKLLNMAGIRAEESIGLLMLAKYGNGALFASVTLFGILDAHARFGMLGLAAGLIALFVGTLLPEAWLKWRAAQRGGVLACSVPDGLDLMVICAEAGLPPRPGPSGRLEGADPRLAGTGRRAALHLRRIADPGRPLPRAREPGRAVRRGRDRDPGLRAASGRALRHAAVAGFADDLRGEPQDVDARSGGTGGGSCRPR